MLTAIKKLQSVAYAASTIAFLPYLVSSAHSQSRTPNPDAPATLRSWPQTSGWETILGRSDGQKLICSMMTGKAEAGRIEYLASLSRWPTEWHMGLADVSQITGAKITLLVDGVHVGDYPITKRQDGLGPLHSVRAIIPTADTTRVLNLMRTGATMQFVTGQLTYTFPLAGAAQSLVNMQSCIVEANSLTHGKGGN